MVQYGVLQRPPSVFPLHVAVAFHARNEGLVSGFTTVLDFLSNGTKN